MGNDAVTVYLGLGSNMGNRQDNLHKALELLSERLRVEKVSSIYDTAPVGNPAQPRFLNQVCQVSTRLAPKDVLALAKGIESKLGRTAGGADRPRPIDIDILFYDEQVIETPELTIPHPRLTERAFVLVPLDEIAPDLVHPVIHKSIRQLLSEVTGVEGVVKQPKGN